MVFVARLELTLVQASWDWEYALPTLDISFTIMNSAEAHQLYRIAG